MACLCECALFKLTKNICLKLNILINWCPFECNSVDGMCEHVWLDIYVCVLPLCLV